LFTILHPLPRGQEERLREYTYGGDKGNNGLERQTSEKVLWKGEKRAREKAVSFFYKEPLSRGGEGKASGQEPAQKGKSQKHELLVIG